MDRLASKAKELKEQLAVKAKALTSNLTEIEIKTLDATNHDAWGPHGSVMAGARRARFCRRPAAQPGRRGRGVARVAGGERDG